MTPADDVTRMDGQVVEILPAATYRIRLENGQYVVGHIAGSMRMHHVRMVPGDRVTVELTPFDLNRARIVQRVK